MIAQLPNTVSMRRIGFVVFDGIERLDFEGPLGVLGWTNFVAGAQFDIRLLSKDGKRVRDHLLKRPIDVDGATTAFSGFDLLIVPGGNLADFQNDKELVKEIRRLATGSSVLLSVCTGAFLVAQTGLADGKTMTTHHDFKPLFRQTFPRVQLAESARFVHDGTLWSSAGITAGIDVSLRLVLSLWGEAVTRKVQSLLEYYPDPPFPPG